MIKPRKKQLHPFVISLGNEIKRLRIQRKITLEELGSDINLDASNMRKIEMGHNITVNTLLKICICLNITPSKLFDKIKWDLSIEDVDSLTTPRIIKKKKTTRKNRV